MKLKNKKTGETGYYLHTHRDYKTGVLKVAVLKDGVPFPEFKPYEPIYDYDSLAELNEEWCDYEEPKEYWFIDEFGLVQKEIEYYYEENKEAVHDKRIAVGNYFETREEAELAVERLRAWKRVKRDLVSLNWQRERDGSFSVWGEFKTGNTLRADVYLDIHSKDLDLLFGGEE